MPGSLRSAFVEAYAIFVTGSRFLRSRLTRRRRFGSCFATDSLAKATKPRYLEIVSPLEAIVEDLKSLPPARLEAAADIVHRLKRISEEERQAILARTAGALSPEEADELNRVIEEGCEKIDESGW